MLGLSSRLGDVPFRNSSLCLFVCQGAQGRCGIEIRDQSSEHSPIAVSGNLILQPSAVIPWKIFWTQYGGWRLDRGFAYGTWNVPATVLCHLSHGPGDPFYRLQIEFASGGIAFPRNHRLINVVPPGLRRFTDTESFSTSKILHGVAFQDVKCDFGNRSSV
jgi:hypothetical protein